jgi:hypothetical protein
MEKTRVKKSSDTVSLMKENSMAFLSTSLLQQLDQPSCKSSCNIVLWKHGTVKCLLQLHPGIKEKMVFFLLFFTQEWTPHFPGFLFILHSHGSCRPSGDCGGSWDRTRNCCVTVWFQPVDLTTELPHPQ